MGEFRDKWAFCKEKLWGFCLAYHHFPYSYGVSGTVASLKLQTLPWALILSFHTCSLIFKVLGWILVSLERKSASLLIFQLLWYKDLPPSNLLLSPDTGEIPTLRNKVNPLLTRNFAFPLIQSKRNESQCSGVALSVTLFYTVWDNQISFFYAGKYNHLELSWFKNQNNPVKYSYKNKIHFKKK